MRRLLERLFFGLLLCVAMPGLTLAQTGAIEGTVIDGQTGEPLPGANIQVVGEEIGTATDAEGNYLIASVPVGAQVLNVSFVGYESVERTVTMEAGATTTADFELLPGVGLDEVVVTALGIERAERSLGYATQGVGADQVVQAAEPTLSGALKGEIAGLQISQSSGQPGKAQRITLRGNTSYREGANAPLVVVDGMPISINEDDNEYDGLGSSKVLSGGAPGRLADIDPSVVENINVLKGASATALYGSRAANGAIIITTKSGQGPEGSVSANFRTRVAVDETIVEGFQDQYLSGNNGCFRNGLPSGRGGYAEENDPNSSACFDPDGSASTQTTASWGPHKDSLSQAALGAVGPVSTYNPYEQFYRSGVTLNNQVGLSASTSLGNLYLNVADTRQEGTVPGTELNRTNMMANFTGQVTDALRVRTSANYVDTENNFLPEANGPNSYLWHLQSTPINFDLDPTEYDDGTQRTYSAASRDNPLWLTDNMAYRSDVKRLIGNAEVSYDILPWLTVKERIGVDTYTDTRKESVSIGTQAAPNGSLYDQSIKRTEVNSDFTISAMQDLTEDFTLDLLVGNNISRRTYNTEIAKGENLSVPDFFNIANARDVTGDQEESERVLIGVFGAGTLDYQDWIYLTLTARNDWSSTLPLDNNSYFYPSANLGFVFTDVLSDVFDSTPLSFGKLRVNWSQVGNDANPYNVVTPYIQANPGDGRRGNIDFPFRGFNGFYESDLLRDAELKPEITTEIEIGADLRFLSDRAQIDATYYNRSTKDQIFEVPQSSTSGYTEIYTNAGEIQNRGWEFVLTGTPIMVGDFSWDLNLNWAKNTTEIIELAEGVNNIFLFGFVEPQIRAEVGEDGYGIIYGSQYCQNGDLADPGSACRDLVGRDAPFEGFNDDTYLIGPDGNRVRNFNPGNIGNVQPDWNGSVRSTFSWKGLSLTQLWETSQGGEILNFDQYYTTAFGVSKWTENRGQSVVFDGVDITTGEENETPVVQDQDWYRGLDRLVMERYVEDASYVKLRELSLSYALPANLIQRTGLSGASITLTGRNLLIFTDFSYGDPAGSLAGSGNGQGFYHGVAPSTRTYSVALSIDV